MADSEPLDRNQKYPLAAYNGNPPPAPDWFRAATDTPYRACTVDVDGAKVYYQQWGDPDKPGLLFIHGNGAHSHWYDFIAPSFIDAFSVVAITFTGMGDSEWRDAYSLEQYTAEQMAVMKEAGFFEHKIKPIVAAHSFGGAIALGTAAKFGQMFKGTVIMDTPIFAPHHPRRHRTPTPRTANVSFPEVGAALSRFRLLPPQPCANHYILDHIARHSLKEIAGENGIEWAWKFDPTLWEKIGHLDLDQWALLPTLPCALAFMRGEHSILVTDEVRDSILSQVKVPFPSVVDAHHHLFLDNPLETISELQTILANWNEAKI